MKRWISVLLTVVMLLSCLTIPAYAEGETSGTCGDNCTWSYADGVLTISGTGAISDMWYSDAPWLSLRGEIRKVIVGEGITDIGYYAFCKCTALTAVSLPSTLKTIRYAGFRECVSLREIVIPEGVTEVGGGAEAFMGCTSLEQVSLPSTLTRISTRCFSGCTSLREIKIPKGVTIIWEESFADCTSLESVSLPEGLRTLVGFCFDNTALKSIKLPSTLEEIGLNCFYGCKKLTSITIPAAVASVNIKAFANCTALTDITFEGDAPSFGKDAFANVTATAKYPADNGTWTEDVMQQYGGNITWVPVGGEEESPKEEEKEETPSQPEQEPEVVVPDDPTGPELPEDQDPVQQEEDEPVQPEQTEPQQPDNSDEPEVEDGSRTDAEGETPQDDVGDPAAEKLPLLPGYTAPLHSGAMLLWGHDPLGLEQPSVTEYLLVARLLAYLQQPNR